MSTGFQSIGKYELRERLGRGGVTEVWKGFDTQLQRYVAIKLLHEELKNNPDFVKRFVREARIVASLHHPNIVQVHDFQVSYAPESDTTTAYMVMDYVEGQTLADYIGSTSGKGSFPAAADIVRLFVAIGGAIDYAHQHGMIHRDIKPANILLDKRRTANNPLGEPILTDFGIAKLLGMSTGAMSGTWLGTPLYIAPEQVQGRPGDERSDIYSLGVVLYEMCTGVLPFRGVNPTAIMMQHVNTMPPLPESINPQISPALSSVILRSLAKDPAARFPSASSMAAALAAAFNTPIPAQVPSSTPSSPFVPPSKKEEGDVPLGVLVTPPSASGTYETFSTVQLVHDTPPLSLQTPTSPAYTPHTRILPLPLTPIPPSSFAPRRRRRGLFILLIALLLVVLGSAGLGTFYLLTAHRNPVATGASTIYGHAFYMSSGLLSEGRSQGIDDEFQVTLQNITAPIAGKSYYAWLLGDRQKNLKENHCQAKQELVSLGRLAVSHGAIDFLYPGDLAHTNLLGCTSRFLITEEDAGSIPIRPSTDKSTWYYYAEIPQAPDPKGGLNPLSVLDEIRHMLFEGSNLITQGIHGGLDIRLLRNSQKVWEWASSARDAWKTTGDLSLIHRQLVRILDYLDGTEPNHLKAEFPHLPILVNNTLAQIALLDIPPQNDSYTARITHQLNVIAHERDVTVTAKMRVSALQLSSDFNNVRQWFKQMHEDAKQLVTLTNTQLQQPGVLALLDDMQTQADYAFVGRIDPATGAVQAGVAQIHGGIQQLAIFDVRAYSPV